MTSGLDDSNRRRMVRSSLVNSTVVRFVITLGVVAALVMLVQPPSPRPAAAQAGSGSQLFDQHCASCHQPNGVGIDGTFPPLAGNPAAADPTYVESVIVDGLSGPIEVLGVPYDEVMPPAVALTDSAQIQEVVQYVVELAAQGAEADGQTAGGDSLDPAEDPADDPADATGDDAESAGPVVGDVARGDDLFRGATGFQNGGAACVGCHTAGSIGNLGGPGLGPDLTETFQTLGGEAGLTGWLANPPSATMRPIFADRPMTAAEVADVVAFLGRASEEQPPSSTLDRLTVAGFAGTAVLIAGMAVAWRGMRQTYVERLRTRGRTSRNGHRRPSTAARTTRSTGATGTTRTRQGGRLPAQARRSNR